MKQRRSEFDRECSYCGDPIPAGKLAWGEQEGLTEHVECDDCHEKEQQPPGRYHARVIADAECTQIHDETLASSDELSTAKNECSQLAGTFPYGGAILDTETGLIDFGFGFGVAVPNPAEAE